MTMVLLLVRHAHAGDREKWVGDDALRPLSDKGHRQADGLVPLLAGFAVDRIVSSPYVRCVETVEPLAAAAGLSIATADALAEGHRDEMLRLIDRESDETLVLCGHGDTVPYLLIALGVQDGFDEIKCSKASTWVVRLGDKVTAEYLPPPKIAKRA